MNQDRYSTYSTILLKYITQSFNQKAEILDIGCSSGELGKNLKDKYQEYVFDGVEINDKMENTAKNNGYRNVFIGNLNISPLKSLLATDTNYDCIVFGDILEHTITPSEVLSSSKEFLKDDGVVAISLPNIGFLYYRILHLLGKWDYKDTGIMDRTHLVFFTLKSCRELINNAGFEIIEEGSYTGLNNWPYLIKKPLKILSKLIPSMFAIQLTFLIKLKSN